MRTLKGAVIVGAVALVAGSAIGQGRVEVETQTPGLGRELAGQYIRVIRAAFGDLNNNGVIDADDLAQLIDRFGSSPPPDGGLIGDLNLDGVVDLTDMVHQLSIFGQRIDMDEDAIVAALIECGAVDTHGMRAFHEGVGEDAPVARDAVAHNPYFSSTWEPGGHDQLASSNFWPPNHGFMMSQWIPGSSPHSGDHLPLTSIWMPSPGHTVATSQGWPANHEEGLSIGWDEVPGHSFATSAQEHWPSNHFGTASATWPSFHSIDNSRWWPPTHAWAQSRFQSPSVHREEFSFTWENAGHDTTITLQRQPANHIEAVSLSWPPSHAHADSSAWPPNHFLGPSASWPSPGTPWPTNHFELQSRDWGTPPPSHSTSISIRDLAPLIPKIIPWTAEFEVEDSEDGSLPPRP